MNEKASCTDNSWPRSRCSVLPTGERAVRQRCRRDNMLWLPKSDASAVAGSVTLCVDRAMERVVGKKPHLSPWIAEQS